MGNVRESTMPHDFNLERILPLLSIDDNNLIED